MKSALTTVLKSNIGQQIISKAKGYAVEKVTDWVISNGVDVVKKQAMVTMTIKNADGQSYFDFLTWLKKNLNKESRYLSGYGVESNMYDLTTVPVFFKYDGHYFYTYKHTISGNNKASNFSHDRDSCITINMLGRNTEVMKKFHKEFISRQTRQVNCSNDENYQISIYNSMYGGSWNHTANIKPRDIDSVVMREDIKKSVMDRIEQWIDSEDFYKERGLPYKLGMIFKGHPGTGKTSFIKAIAGKLRFDIYMLNIKHVSDENIANCLRMTGRDSIIVVEEFDSCIAMSKREGVEESKNDVVSSVTLHIENIYGDTIDEEYKKNLVIEEVKKREGSLNENKKTPDSLTIGGLLTAIDGIVPLDDRIIILTTNVINMDKFDKAFLRKGRIDEIYEIPLMGKTEIKKYFNYMYPGEDFPDDVNYIPVAGCDVQDIFLNNKFNSKKFLKKLKKLYEDKGRNNDDKDIIIV